MSGLGGMKWAEWAEASEGDSGRTRTVQGKLAPCSFSRRCICAGFATDEG